MNYQIIACIVMFALATIVALLDHRGIWKRILAGGILVAASFTLYFSVEQSARDATTKRNTPAHIKSEYGAGIYAMKSALQTERICLVMMFLSLTALSMNRK